MFGTVVANLDKLSEDDKMLYGACYCGLCRTLGERHGVLSRACVNYDMTFFILVHSSLTGPDLTLEKGRCPVHPFKPRQFGVNEISEYIADMNIVMSYHNLIDDWVDERQIRGLMGARLLEKAYEDVESRYPDKCRRIGLYMDELAVIEKDGVMNPDIPGNCCGELIAEAAEYGRNEYTAPMRDFSRALGKFIYVLDACVDLKRDLKKESYNPMLTTPTESFEAILESLMGDCVEKYEALGITRNRELIDNILYSGIWTKWEGRRK